MALYMAEECRCDTCTNSRAVVSENGIHYDCCLPKKQCLDCLFGVKDSYDGYSDIPKKGE